MGLTQQRDPRSPVHLPGLEGIHDLLGTLGVIVGV